MDPIVLAAGGALVSAMATDGWQHARAAVVAWFRQLNPDQVDSIYADLEVLRDQVAAARAEADQTAEQTLVRAWRSRLQQLLDGDPELAAELRQLLEEHVNPGPSQKEQAQARSVVMRAEARDNSRVYMAGRDQHIAEGS
ncbi:conserved hypothetical protein [Streptomyces himastatinicus ATCC 53653]|uniref:Uncharacterized protein n=1 Tax=Streptomyces himastatinicus ATCC 53653 TaxID=457427 RepID=D9WM34_9ACTN|nr:hypothetical protein [Streptomyces himastatinicus]EFL25737.1 conserved hypothetical protein [Streptomyces himastatinicus ATCC 53653]